MACEIQQKVYNWKCSLIYENNGLGVRECHVHESNGFRIKCISNVRKICGWILWFRYSKEKERWMKTRAFFSVHYFFPLLNALGCRIHRREINCQLDNWWFFICHHDHQSLELHQPTLFRIASANSLANSLGIKLLVFKLLVFRFRDHVMMCYTVNGLFKDHVIWVMYR